MPRSNFHAVIEIEVTCALLEGNPQLVAFKAIFVPIDDGPDSLTFEWPAAREDAKIHGRVEGLPVGTHQKRGDASLKRCHSTGRFAVPRCDAIPDPPDVFPAFPADAVKERDLQIVRVVAIQSIRDMDHVARFQPFQAVDRRYKLCISTRIGLLPPR